MSQGAEKAKAQRDKEMARLLAQYNTTEAEARKELVNLTAEMRPTTTSFEVKKRIAEVVKIIDKWVTMQIIDPHSDYGELVFEYEAELSALQGQVKFDIDYVNDILSDLRIAVQMEVASLQSWKGKISWRAIEAAMENTELFVDTSEVHTGQRSESTDDDDDEGAI